MEPEERRACAAQGYLLLPDALSAAQVLARHVNLKFTGLTQNLGQL
jgi:hypothetical protein